MYIDFLKYNYSIVSEEDREQYMERDKKAYKKILRNWLEDNIDEMVERKWQIEDMFYLEEISEFLKLLREAENLYELGFYTSCIALVCVATEDFSKYLILENQLKEKDTQYKRLRYLRNKKIIEKKEFNLLDEIRRIRNDCLHYNDKFKQKNNKKLKEEALKVLNNLKKILKGLNKNRMDISYEEFLDIIFKSIKTDLTSVANVKNNEDRIFRERNAHSHFFDFNLAQHPSIRENVRISFYKIAEIDLKISDNGEVTLFDMDPKFPMPIPVCVDLTDKDKEKIVKFKEGDLIFAIIKSEITEMGQSAFWKFECFGET